MVPYQDDWMTGNDFILSNPNDLLGQSNHLTNQSGLTNQITYTNEPIYLVPSVPTGTSTGDGTSQNHTSNQRTNDHTGTNANSDEIGSMGTGDFPFGISHEEHVIDEASPDGNFDQSESSIAKNLTERELSDPTWNIFRLSKMEEKIRSGFKFNFCPSI